ncbi:guanine deaminase [Vagococcus xieshaowenii]|uniref:Guanine deaminase n=1 Tax=Vagococcus xieshaowenii TaxID=2562451 RepID=A0AAJ5EEC5_9ENTE|nr:guanine deaminase [Vagococcus xieshaowenii]QCA27931.1 guanine deaminase [Vagococcus xieshaowenii]TFZ40316.1 guanine deaminase [Vagococcus xieshaowenii]
MKYFKGSIFHTPIHGELIFIEEALIEVDEKGNIQSVFQPDDQHYQEKLEIAKTDVDFVELSKGQYFLPGFVDLHVHAPQWPQAGVALDEPLNHWLDECTFPLEAKYEDVDFAKRVYQDLVDHLLSRGTTTVLYFATAHLEASLALAKICGETGQRALVGKVVMDHPEMTPTYYRDQSAERALADTEQFIHEVQQMAPAYQQGIYPVITPRFVPSCTDESLAGLGELARQYDVHVQSHCSEGQWAHDHVIERFGKRDTEVLREFGLLTEKSVMAHCNFIDEHDGDIFIETGTAVAHCPISNAYFANGVLPVKHLKEQGVEMGLGTDISGGFSPSLWDNIKQAVMSSRMLEDGVDVTLPPSVRGVEASRISVIEAFSLATQGGGEALSLPIGVFAPGYTFDAQVLDMTAQANQITGYGVFNQPEAQLQKLLYLATPENIKQVWVQGQLVHHKS